MVVFKQTHPPPKITGGGIEIDCKQNSRMGFTSPANPYEIRKELGSLFFERGKVLHQTTLPAGSVVLVQDAFFSRLVQR